MNKGEAETVDALAGFLEDEGDLDEARAIRKAWLEQLTPEEVRLELARRGASGVGLDGLPEDAAASVRGVVKLVRQFPTIAGLVLLRAKALARAESGELDTTQASPAQ